MIMAVGYLACDWRPEFVKTQERGKKFVFAAHNFDTERGKVGLGFYSGTAFALYSEDENRYMYAYELNDFFKEMVDDEEERTFSDEEDDYVPVMMGGSKIGDFDNIGFEDADEVMRFYNDISSRYWV